jgi:CsoR family transcriptional regulator, copper-sensing transcriptional repressor
MRTDSPKKEILVRLRRIEGQIRGIHQMVENSLPCANTLTQVAAVTAAMKRVGRIMVQTYISECLEKSRKGSGTKKTEILRDLEKVISQYIDWA